MKNGGADGKYGTIGKNLRYKIACKQKYWRGKIYGFTVVRFINCKLMVTMPMDKMGYIRMDSIIMMEFNMYTLWLYAWQG